MRPLSSTLLAAQRAASSVPYARAEVVDARAGVPRLAWSRLYTGTEPDFYHAAILAGDGSLVRARVGASDYRLYRQRTTAPGPGSDFGTWTLVADISSDSGIALASAGSRVALCSVGQNQYSIYARESTDYGAAFGSPLNVANGDSAVRWMAAAFKDADRALLLYATTSPARVWGVRRTAAGWEAPFLWLETFSSITGLACAYDGDWQIIVAGVDTQGNARLRSVVLGDGSAYPVGEWSSPEVIVQASAGAGVTFRAPFLAGGSPPRLSFVEAYIGQAPYSRPNLSHLVPGSAFAQGLWREPIPFNLASSYGTALALDGPSAEGWLSTPSGVWRAQTSSQPLDLTDDVLEMRMTQTPAGGALSLALRNDDGRYSSPGSGVLAALDAGAEVRVGPGYETSAGREVSPGLSFWIEGWEHAAEGDASRLTLHARDAWGLLDAWVARYQYAWASGEASVKDILAYLLGRAGLVLQVTGGSSALTTLTPAFTLHPGEKGSAAVRRLLALAPDTLSFRGATALVRDTHPSDPADYAYGTDHAIAEGLYASRCRRANRVQVYGQTVVGESFAWDEVERVPERLRQVQDRNLTTVEEAQARCAAELRREELDAVSGDILVPVNCGQELYDVVEVTDARAGLVAARRRVLGLELQYRRSGRRARYAQRITLGGV